MRVVLDTNIPVSALLIPAGYPDAIYQGWTEGQFSLLTGEEQLDELRATLQKPAIAVRVKPSRAGRPINEIRAFAGIIGKLPRLPGRLSGDWRQERIAGSSPPCQVSRNER
ncbi:MAG TPA: PIN domain-containing protein [Bryobacteraceae bacterium]|jgi:predicted nucleic acid-binding protein|nr:PIN domain-containing protein [Bryobacteraceae bacterium]